MTATDVTATSDHLGPPREDTAPWELARALGTYVLTPPPDNAAVCRALGLPAIDRVEHTDVFVLGAPPHAAIHLGPEGMLGGEGLDRVAGFWRALGMSPPHDCDHLGVLLLLYAELGSAEDAAPPARSQQLCHARHTLLHEHLWSWAPGYLDAVAGIGSRATRAWAGLLQRLLHAEVASAPPPPRLPLALRVAPPQLTVEADLAEVLDTLTSPVRSGVVLTYADLGRAAAATGAGLRRGERRFALRALLEQDPRGTLSWSSRLATSWAETHRRRGDDPTTCWWGRRAAATAGVLAALADRVPRP